MSGLEPLVWVLGLYVAWNIGANDSAKAIGTSLRAHVLSARAALVLMAVFAILGAVVAGPSVSRTVDRILVGSGPGMGAALLVSLGCAGLWVTLATWRGIPVSTTQSILGGLAGSGLALSLRGAPVRVELHLFGGIALAWLLAPVLAGLVAYASHRILGFLLAGVRDLVRMDRIIATLAVLNAALTAFMVGSNDGGNLAGALRLAEPGFPALPLLALVGGGIALGAFTFSRRVIEAVGDQVATMSPAMAFTAQFGASLVILSMNILPPLLGLPAAPVSSAQAIIGGVIGAGLVKGGRTLHPAGLPRMVAMWLLTPLATAGLALLASGGLLAALGNN
ncbi:MAG: inorganic phosphate transporter [Euryarchaeota archaeon]|nr:inorganic phosphate transporter [Euryarchaeota archaeon]